MIEKILIFSKRRETHELDLSFSAYTRDLMRRVNSQSTLRLPLKDVRVFVTLVVRNLHVSRASAPKRCDGECRSRVQLAMRKSTRQLNLSDSR